MLWTLAQFVQGKGGHFPGYFSIMRSAFGIMGWRGGVEGRFWWRNIILNYLPHECWPYPPHIPTIHSYLNSVKFARAQ